MTSFSFTRRTSVLSGVALLLFWGCSRSGAVEQIGGISGTAQAQGKPLPEGAILSFMNVDVDESFMTTVSADGTYRYKPFRGVPVRMGKYKVVVMPPPPRMVMKDNLLVRDPNDKESYQQIAQKYRAKATTPLEVDVGESPVEFAIQLQ